MNPGELNSLIAKLAVHEKAKNPIDPGLLEKIPHFTRIFPNKELWPLLVRLSGDDGIAHFEKKFYHAGETLISKGKFDQMIYWVLSGHADIVTTIKNHPKIIHKSNPGECIGALGVLRGAVRTADVIAGEQGVGVIELDWAVTEKNPELGKALYHLIALNLADELDQAYTMQVRIIANSIQLLQEKTLNLIEKNRRLEKLLKENHIPMDNDLEPDQAQALNLVIDDIKESMSLLKMQADHHSPHTPGKQET